MLLLTSIINVFFVLFPVVESANILFVALAPASSHQIVFQAIWKELSLKGHKVHVITPNPLRDPELTNLTEIDISSVYRINPNTTAKIVEKYIDFLLKATHYISAFGKKLFVTYVYFKLNEFIFNHINIQQFLSEEHQFDVCIIEWQFPTMGAFGAKYNCPIVGVTSTGAPIPALDALGNPYHPAYVPDHDLPVSRDMTFKERIFATIYATFERLHHHFIVLPRNDKLIKKYLGENLPYLGDIEKNISILLLNRNTAFHRIMPTVPAVIELGGIQLTRAKETLSPELKQFLDNSKKGVIYFSLGSSIKTIFLSKEICNIFYTTLSQLPYEVLWKWDDDVLPGNSSNIFFQKWFPQLEVLKHPNVKLFISSGGQQSSEDSIYNHVPVLGIPFNSDQTSNLDTCRMYGMGKWIQLSDITIENFNSTIFEIINNPKYKENAAKLSILMKDQPDDCLKKAIWWIEYVIRHKGARHLRSPAVDMGWIQYLLLDVIAFLFAVLLITYFITYKILKLIFKIHYLVITKLFGKSIQVSDKKK